MKQIKAMTPLVTAVLGLAALLLRFFLYHTALDEKGLLLRGHPLTILLLALTACAALAAFRISGKYTAPPAGRPDIRAAVGLWVFALGMLFPGAGDTTGVFTILLRLQTLLQFVAVLALAVAGYARLQGRAPHFVCHVLVCLYLVIRNVVCYQIWSNDPQMLDYVFSLLGGLLLTLFVYRTAAMSVGLGKGRSRLFYGLFGSYCCLAALPGESCRIFYASAAVWMTVSALWETPQERT